MGNAVSDPAAARLASQIPDNARLFGLRNFGNTCYCNSVLQALFHTPEFRENVLQYGNKRSLKKNDFEQEVPKPGRPGKVGMGTMGLGNMQMGMLGNVSDSSSADNKNKETILSSLANLFLYVIQQKRKTMVIGPKQFRTTLGNENIMFAGPQQQDAHEFLYYLLTAIDENVQEAERVASNKNSGKKKIDPSVENNKSSKQTWIRKMFEGELKNETLCLRCERCTHKAETFWDLSLDLELNTSIMHCLQNFFKPELLKGKNKFFCDSCNGLQEAQKRMLVSRCPKVLLLHLKRFKYNPQFARFAKLGYLISFPMELRLLKTTPDVVPRDPLYALFAIVIHKGSGPNHGHYVTYVKCFGRWLYFDDENVEMKHELDVMNCFGSPREEFDYSTGSTGYILFYKRVDDESLRADCGGVNHVDAKSPSSTNSSYSSSSIEGSDSGDGGAAALGINEEVLVTELQKKEKGEDNSSNNSSAESEETPESESAKQMESQKG